MARAVYEELMSNYSSMVKFTTEYHDLSFANVGAGLAVIIPEWDDFALVLTKDDLRHLRGLIDSVLAEIETRSQDHDSPE